LDDCSPDCESQLVASGFEPDDFLELNPAIYRRNFTFAFDTLVGSDTSVFRRQFRERIHTVEALIERTEHFGFLEAEIFPSRCIMQFDQRDASGVSYRFPFEATDFEVCEIPDRVTNAPTDMSPFTRKNIDLHVKIKGRIKEETPRERGYIR